MKKGIATIKDALASKGWSQRRLAKESGLTEASISKYFSGQRSPSLLNIKALADALDLEPMELINDFIKEE